MLFFQSDLPNTVLAEKPFVDKKSLKALQSQFAAVGEKKRKQLFKDLIQGSSTIMFGVRDATSHEFCSQIASRS